MKKLIILPFLLFSLAAMCQQSVKPAVDSSKIPILSEYDLNQFYQVIQKIPHDEYQKMKEDPAVVLNALLSWKRNMIRQVKLPAPVPPISPR